MNGKQIAGLACFGLAALLAVSAILSLTRGDGPAVDDRSGLGVSRVVGAFLLPLLALILALWLIKSPKPRDNDQQDSAPRT